MANAKCETCRFFDEHKGNGAVAQNDAGLCRFNPPVSQPRPSPRASGRWSPPATGAATTPPR